MNRRFRSPSVRKLPIRAETQEVVIRSTFARGTQGARILIPALVLLLAAAVAVVAAPIRSAVPDSTHPGGLLNTLDFHPTYQTGYTVNRSSRDWSQNLNFSRRVGVLDLTNSWVVGLRKDKNQNNLRAKRGEMKFGLNYLLKSYGDWTVGLDGTFRRDGSFSTYKQTTPGQPNRRDQVENKSDFGLTVATRAPSELLHRFIPLLRDWNLSTSGSAGLNNDRSISRRQKLLDSTRVTGIYQHYDMGLDGTLAGIRVTTRMLNDRSTGDSNTRQRDAFTDTLKNETKQSTNNRSQNMQGSLDYVRGEKLRANVQGHRNDETNQYWDIQANSNNGGQESKDGKDHGFGASVDWNPTAAANVHADFTRQDLQADYKLQARDFFKRTDSGKFNGKLKLPSILFLPLGGIEVESGLQVDKTDNVLEETADYKQNNRRLRNVLRRQFGSKVQLQATNELSLLQYLYDDKSSDRDERRIFADGVLLYNPSMKFNGTFNVNWSERHSVNIPADKAANNSTTQSYKVSGELGYKRALLSLNQRYTVQADYTYYDFNENQNNLARSNEVLTTVSDRLTSGWGFQVQHTYQFRDQGMYLRPAPRMPRAYRAGTKETRHMMTLTVSYPIGSEVRIEARQMFDRRASRVVASGRINKTTRGELGLRGDLNHKFNRDFSLTASIQKTQSTSEQNYWTINAGIMRNF